MNIPGKHPPVDTGLWFWHSHHSFTTESEHTGAFAANKAVAGKVRGGVVRGGGGGGACTHFMHSRGPLHPYNAGTEYVEFSSTRQTSRAPSAKRREVFGESHEE